MQIIKTISCKLGIHKGEWLYNVHINNCQQTRICTHCNKLQARIHHRHFTQYEYFRLDNCDMQRTCTYCGTQEIKKNIHQWQQWEFKHLHTCEQISECSRCNAQKYRYQHMYSPAHQYISPNTCEVCEVCMRCQHKHHLHTEEHKWQVLKVSKKSIEKICTRCNKEISIAK